MIVRMTVLPNSRVVLQIAPVRFAELSLSHYLGDLLRFRIISAV